MNTISFSYKGYNAARYTVNSVAILVPGVQVAARAGAWAHRRCAERDNLR